MQATEKIWMNGELVDWDDARIHVGAHGLHYGTGVFEGIRCYDTPKGPGRVPPHRSHAAPAQLGAADQHGDPVLGRRPARRRRTTCSARTASRECYIRPIAFYGYGQLGVSARDNPVETVIMSLAVGHLPRRGGARRPASGRRSRPGSACRRTSSRTPRRRPASTSTRCSRSTRRSAPATTRRSCSRPTARSPTGRARRSSSSRAGRSTRPTSRPGSCTGSRATRSSRSRPTSATR